MPRAVRAGVAKDGWKMLGGFKLGGGFVNHGEAGDGHHHHHHHHHHKHSDASSEEDDESYTEESYEDVDQNMTPAQKEWIKTAESGELDIYTCIGLSNGHDRFGARTRSMMTTLGTLMFLQLMLPGLLMTWSIRNHVPFDEQGWEFRIIGFGLYMYAVSSMYEAALDECRSQFLALSVEHNISPWYTLPMLLGEFANAITAVILTLSLFVIFVISETPVDLILNSLAINYLVSADNDFQEDEIKNEAKRLFRYCIAHEIDEPVTKAAAVRNKLMKCAMFVLDMTRRIGILGVGCILGVTFFFQWETELCEAMPSNLQRGLQFCAVA